jgi:nicotinate-nucleotide pyrophosphorylase (carboxylating)
LAEDVGPGDATAQLIPADSRARATLITRQEMILCGSPWVRETFRLLDKGVAIDWRAQEGDHLSANDTICEIRGPARAILTGERCALNFLQTLSATATQTRRHVDAVLGTACQILDTRKTIPGLRLAQKYAVRCGGGRNHRMGLYDMVLIKENHIIAAGSIAAALLRARAAAPGLPVEIEVETLEEFKEALQARPDVIMLDEFKAADMHTAVALRNASGHAVKLEASGGLDLASLRAVAETGVDYISVGSLTKHVQAIDLSLRFKID